MFQEGKIEGWSGAVLQQFSAPVSRREQLMWGSPSRSYLGCGYVTEMPVGSPLNLRCGLGI